MERVTTPCHTHPVSPAQDIETKLKAVQRAAAYSFPTADIGQMLDEIEQGYAATST
jgi:hypothetical protein